MRHIKTRTADRTTIGRRAVLTGGAAIAAVAVVGCSRSQSASPSFETEPNVPVFVLLSKASPAPATILAGVLGTARTAGVIADATLITATDADAPRAGFAAFGILEFRDQAAFKAWGKAGAAALGKGVALKEADVLFDDRPRVQSPAPIYVVDEYEAMLPQEDYFQYVRLYIAPNMAAQKAGGLLAGYAVYWEREPNAEGRHRVVLVKEYFNEDAFSRIDVVRAGNEPTLLKNPDWKRIHEVKSRYRTDLSSTKATPVALT